MNNQQDIWKLVEQFQVLHPRIRHSALGTKREVEVLPQLLKPNETALFMAVGFWKWKVWFIVATDQRILLLNKGILFSLKTQSFPYNDLQSFRMKEKRGFKKIHLWDGINTVNLNYCLPTDAERLNTAVRSMKNRQSDKYRQKETNFRLRGSFRT